jgi:hypothetical protein
LAIVIGLHEAMIVQQIHYWVELFRTAGRQDHYQEGHWWVWNSIRQWQEDNFPFWSRDTVRRVFIRLENPFEPLNGRDRRLRRPPLVITGNFNKMACDQTKWYRIDYDALDAVIERFELRESERIAAERAVNLLEREPLFASAIMEGDDCADLWETAQPGDGSTGDGSTGDGSTGDGSPGDGSTGDGSTGGGFLDRMRAQGVDSPLGLAAETFKATGGALSWTVPASAGGASAYGPALQAFCALTNHPIKTLPDAKAVSWLEQLEQIAEDNGIESPDVLTRAIRGLRYSHTWFLENNVWTSPYVDSFVNGVALIAARLMGGQDVEGEHDGSTERTRPEKAGEKAAVGLGRRVL